jgi:hypothetical protein
VGGKGGGGGGLAWFGFFSICNHASLSLSLSPSCSLRVQLLLLPPFFDDEGDRKESISLTWYLVSDADLEDIMVDVG